MDVNFDLRDLIRESEIPCSTCSGIGIAGCLGCGGSGKVLNEIGRDLLFFLARWTRVDGDHLVIRSYRSQDLKVKKAI